MTIQKFRRHSLHYPDMPIYQLLKETADRLPKKTAVIDPQGRRELTFREIDQESDGLAGTFLHWGIKKGDRISFFMSNGWEYFVAFYAAMKVGAIVSPMNPTFREREVKASGQRCRKQNSSSVQSHLYPGVEESLQDLPTLEKIIVTRGQWDGVRKGLCPYGSFGKNLPTTASLSALPLDAKEDSGRSSLFVGHGGVEQRGDDLPLQPGVQHPSIDARRRGS